MPRKQLLKTFTVEGGLFSRRQRTFVLKQCLLIKVDVKFHVNEKNHALLADEVTDDIVEISRPYLQNPIVD